MAASDATQVLPLDAATTSPPQEPVRTTSTTTTTSTQPTHTTRDMQVVSAANEPWEVLVAGTGNNNEEFEAGGASGIASVGYYFSDVVEFSVRQNAAYAHAGTGSPEIWNFASRAAIDLHIPLGPVVPYVGGNIGYAYGDSIEDSLMAGPEGGVKLYLQDDAFLTLGAEYEFFFDRGDSLETAFDRGQFLWTLGMGMRF